MRNPPLSKVVSRFDRRSTRKKKTHPSSNMTGIQPDNPILLTTPAAHQLVSAFFPKEWAITDISAVSYNYRSFDLGGQFSERMYCYSQRDNQLIGYADLDVE
jgi:hypothetical protein